MDYEGVNYLLKRTLQSGKQYNRYFSKSSCTPSYLGASDTAFTVTQMKKWAYKNVGQTAELAKNEFSRVSLQGITQKVYSFLYNHIQYELDRKRQNLKSPACAWATRVEGTDCKSYSIFASTILLNLGIKHYFRRVRQPGLQPNKWTHVYIIVPKNQKNPPAKNPKEYFVIDATVHDNKEVDKIDQDDTLMSKVKLPHYGLQSPAISGLGACSCTLKPNVAPTLVVVSVPIKTPIKTVRSSTSTVSTGRRSLENEIAGMRMPGIGRRSVEDYLKFTPPTKDNTKLSTAIQNTIVQSSQKGTSASTIVKSAIGILPIAIATGPLAPFALAATGIISLIPGEFFNRTLGQIFEGFDCVGSSWTPKKGKAALLADTELIKNKAAELFQITDIRELPIKLNEFLEYFYSIRSTERDWLNTSAKDCTKRGIKVMIMGLDALKAEILGSAINATAQEGHRLEKTTPKTVKYPPEQHTDRHALTQSVEQYRLVINQNALPQNNSANNVATKGNDLVRYASDPIKEAGFGVGAILALAAIAGGAYYYKN